MKTNGSHNAPAILCTASRNEASNMLKTETLLLLTGDADCPKPNVAQYCMDVIASGREVSKALPQNKKRMSRVHHLGKGSEEIMLTAEGTGALHGKLPLLGIHISANPIDKKGDLSTTTEASIYHFKEQSSAVATIRKPRPISFKHFSSTNLPHASRPRQVSSTQVTNFGQGSPWTPFPFPSCAPVPEGKLSPLMFFPHQHKSSFAAPFRTSRHESTRTLKLSMFARTQESVLPDYWKRKKDVVDKYLRLFAELEAEEKAEIYLFVGKNARANFDPMAMYSIREEYERIKDLLLRQKVMELEELLAEFEQKLST